MESDPKMNNVIMFPGVIRNRPPQSLEEICRSVALAKSTRIEEVTEGVVVNLFEDLYMANFDFTERVDANKDMAMLIEALKSLLSRHDGMHHPFQDKAELLFTADAKGDLTFVPDTEIEVTDIEEEK